MNFFPLWTASVCPTISGKTVERRDHVLTTFLSNFLLSSSIFLRRCSSTKGPLRIERAMRASLLPPADDERVRPRVVACLLALGRNAPGRTRRPAARGPPLAAAVRVVDRGHCHAPHGGPPALPAVAARLADALVLVLDVADLADRGPALLVDLAGLARGEP